MSSHPCQDCEGTGWKPIETDGIRRVVRCSCQGDRQTESLLEKARIPRRYAECEFENFHVRKDRASGSNRSLEGAKLFARRFVEEYPTDFGLLFVGPTGV